MSNFIRTKLISFNWSVNSASRAILCEDTDIDGDAQPHGVITSRSYPNYENDIFCQLNLRVSDPNKVFKFYLTDINIAPPNFVSQA